MGVLQHLAEDSSRANIDRMVGMVLHGVYSLSALASFVHTENYPINVRAARVFITLVDKDPELATAFVDDMVLAVERDQACASLKKELLKFFTLIDIPECHQGFLLDYCITCSLSRKETKAARVYAMQVVYNISQLQPELKPEVLLVFQELCRSELPSVGGRSRKLTASLCSQLSRLPNKGLTH